MRMAPLKSRDGSQTNGTLETGKTTRRAALEYNITATVTNTKAGGRTISAPDKALIGFMKAKISEPSYFTEFRRMRREYTGDWLNDKKTGRGTMFFQNGNRYDGLWLDDKPHGEGRMIYANGDVYEGMWFMGQRSGYGVVTKRNGDHFEGHWVNDKRVLSQSSPHYIFYHHNSYLPIYFLGRLRLLFLRK